MQIAEALLLFDDTIHQPIRNYKELKKLKPENCGTVEKLSSDQSKEFEKHLQKHRLLKK